MGALPSTKLQVNFSTPGRTLINVYGDDEIELRQMLDALGDMAGLITETEKLFGAVSTVATVLGGNVVPATAGPQAAPQGLPPGMEQQFCQHGEMRLKSGVSKAGNNYSVFECPANTCDVKWPPRKR